MVLFSCNNILEYQLSYSRKIIQPNKIIPAPNDRLFIEKDSVFIQEYEPYIPIKKGIILNDYMCFSNDTIQFFYKNNILITIEDSIYYYWEKINK